MVDGGCLTPRVCLVDGIADKKRFRDLVSSPRICRTPLIGSQVMLGPQLLSIWGKWDESRAPLPLLAHLLDTGAFATAIWNYLSATQRDRVADLISPSNPERARSRFATLAALHDLGKAEPVFQGQQWSTRRGEFAHHLAELTKLGLPTEPPSKFRPRVGDKQKHLFRHEAVTADILKRLTELPSWARLVVAGHHGRYPWDTSLVPVEAAHMRNAITQPAWSRLHEELIRSVVETYSPRDALSEWPRELDRGLLAFLPLLTGLICLTDWLASDSNFVDHSPRELLTSPADYATRRVSQAEDVLDSRWGHNIHPSGAFADLFDGKQPDRPVQDWAVASDDQTGLTVIMVPTGEGKTETALWLHAAGAAVQDGLIFGLPTMATADAMFERVQSFYRRSGTIGHLAHSRSRLNAFYSESDIDPVDQCSEDDTEEPGLRPSDWFSGSHRGLLAPVTVGTCDQILAAAVNHKYIQVRLAALAGKHVVLDEVHTYDAYQHILLKRLLGWLGAYRVRTTLLSATLPTSRLRDYIGARQDGWHNRIPKRDRPKVDLEQTITGQYPAVVRVHDQVEVLPLGCQRHYTLALECHTFDGDRKAFLEQTIALVNSVRQAEPRARIGVMVNTVDRAITIAQRLEQTAAEPVLLLHSRMTATQRARTTQAVYDMVGPAATGPPSTTVSTQIAEASLDLDFDVLISDLSPISSLVQRAGRLWRHSTPIGEVWEHPTHRTYRRGAPVLHIVIPLKETGLHREGVAPYTRAELLKTWRDCLIEGARNEIAVPGDIQDLVDTGEVSWADLSTEAMNDPHFSSALQEHLGADAAKKISADGTGYRPSDLSFPFSADQSTDDNLAAMTAPKLFADDAVTRLRDVFQIQLLPFDIDAEHPVAWRENPFTAHVPIGSDLLAHVIPVTGQLAKALLSLANLPPDWHRNAPAMLRNLVPLSINDFSEVAYLDPHKGLIRIDKEE